MKNAIICCSGGIDSVTTAHHVKKKLKYDNLLILFFNYGQRTLKQERQASKNTAKQLNAKFKQVNLTWLGDLSQSLINKKEKHKKISRKELKNTSKDSQNYYVPCRNTMFLTHALAVAESIFVKTKQTGEIFVGFKNEGKESYPDTTSEFVKKINALAKSSCMVPTKIIAPLITKDKEDIIKIGTKLKINYAKTFTCYIGTQNKFQHCGTCLSCRLRQEGFYWANISDPTNYLEKMKDFRTAKTSK